MKKLSKKALRSDHELIKEAKDIMKRQGKLCKAISKEVGFNCAWPEVIELADGMSPYKVFYRVD